MSGNDLIAVGALNNFAKPSEPILRSPLTSARTLRSAAFASALALCSSDSSGGGIAFPFLAHAGDSTNRRLPGAGRRAARRRSAAAALGSVALVMGRPTTSKSAPWRMASVGEV